MKARRLSLVFALALLGAFLLVAPVQAGHTVTPVAFCWTELTTDTITEETLTGQVWHGTWLLEGPVWSDDPRLTGFLSWAQEATVVIPNPHIWEKWWGPAPGHWKMVVPQEDGSLAGWEGISTLQPQSDSSKWPWVGTARGTGKGFGRYKNMTIKWTINGVPPTCEAGIFFSGKVSENGQ